MVDEFFDSVLLLEYVDVVLIGLALSSVGYRAVFFYLW
jgi:hypothetical protein